MRQASLEQTVTLEIARLFEPLASLTSAGAVAELVRELGWRSASGQTVEVDLSGLVERVEGLVRKANALARAGTDEEVRAAAVELAGDLLLFVDELRKEMPRIEAALLELSDLVGSSEQVAEALFTRLIDYLVYEYLASYRPRAFATLHVLGIAEEVVDGSGQDIRTVQWERIPWLFSDPLALANEVYNWSEAFEGDKFLSRLGVVMQAFMLPGGIYPQDGAIQEAAGSAPRGRELRIPVHQAGRWPDYYTEFDLNLSPVPEKTGDQSEVRPGLVLYPSLFGAAQQEWSEIAGWVVRLRGTAELEAGFGIELRPPHALRLAPDLFGEDPSFGGDGRLELAVARETEAQELYYLFGTKDASHVAVQQVGLTLMVSAGEGEPELSAELEIESLTIAVSTAGADAFVDKLLSGINIQSTADLALGYSNLDGVYFRGSGALGIEIPLHIGLSVVELESLFIGVGIEEGFAISLAASLSGELGPIAVNVQRVGMEIPIGFPPDRDGNLGPVDVSEPRFKPPTGAGLSLATGPIVGGGFLDIDEANGRYSGGLGLQMYEIGLVAIGLITTKLPDGSEGFALLINIGVEFDPPVQLSFGFTLSAVGGLVGVNRTMDVEALQRGVRQGTLDSILFPDPDDVVQNASQIISDMRSVFPTKKDRVVVGPMVTIGWGSPPIIIAELGIFLDLPDPVRVALMGQLTAILPSQEKGLVVIHLDVLGVLDFEKQELTFQASLYDSRILSFELSGDSAFLLSWGDEPQFALSLGGFHPKFPTPSPPVVFADLKRLSLALSSGKKFQLTCRAYQALTPNSVQFGARADLEASAMGATVRGRLGFDALIYMSPFSFEVQINAGVRIKYEGKSLADVDLSLFLSGPAPWLARGAARFKVLWFSVKIRFSITWGKRDTQPLPAVDPLEEMVRSLGAPESWGTVLPPDRRLVESLRPLDEEAVDRIVVHPAGRFEVRQNVAPLGIDLSKAGSAPIKGHDRFEIRDVYVGGHTTDVDRVEEFFARGQFEDLAPGQKLETPAFERMPAGVKAAGSTAVRADGSPEHAELAYESLLLHDDRTSARQPDAGEADWEDAQVLVDARGRKRAARRAGNRDKYLPRKRASKVRVRDTRYAVVEADTLAVIDLEETSLERNMGLSRVEAEQLLREHPALAERTRIVPEYELEEGVA